MRTTVVRGGLVGGALLVATGLAACGASSLPSVAVSPPAAKPVAARRCADIHGHLPATVADSYDRRRTSPESKLTAAWGDPPITYQCGVRPPTLPLVGSDLIIDGVDWLITQNGDTVTWRTLHEKVTVEVDVPTRYDDQDAILTDISVAVRVLRPTPSVSPS